MMYRHTMIATLALSLAACGEMADDKADDTDAMETDMADTDDTTDTDAAASIVDTVVNTDRFSILEAAVIKADLAGALTGGITVFAPNDTAFQALFDAVDGIDSADDLSVDQLTAILTYHVLDSEVDAMTAIGVAEGDGTTAALGGSLDLTYDGTTLSVDDADVIAADIPASDGIIHEIDAVLIPSIADVVTTDAELTTLTAAVVAADGDTPSPDLVATLDGAGDFTLFAPTDDAFADLLSGNSFADLTAVVTALGGLPELTELLQYHVLGSRVDSTAAIAASGMTVTPLAGGTIDVDVISNSVVLNDGVNSGLADTNTSTVVTVDILTSNGWIHKIDKVIAPAAGEQIEEVAQ